MRTPPSSHPWRISLLASAVSLGLACGLAPSAHSAPAATPSPVGYVADGQDWSAVNDADYPDWPAVRGITKLDLRDSGFVPAVRKQDAGDCWAFAATGSAMSGLARRDRSSVDLSPIHLVYSVFNERGITGWRSSTGATATADPLTNGANSLLASSAWSKHYGAQTEAFYPLWQAATALSLTQVMTSAYHQRDAWVLPRNFDSQGNFDRNNVQTVKNALWLVGALAIAYYADDGQQNDATSRIYNAATAALYNKFAHTENHGALLIGWDDNFKASNFSTAPPGDGAWIVQNSWGPDKGIGGYFYLSYYDVTAKEPWFFNMVPAGTDTVQHVTFLDDGAPSKVTDYRVATVFEANILQVPTTPGTQWLKAVSFYTKEPLESYEISVYKDPTTTPTSGTLVDVSNSAGTAVTGQIPSPGWNRIALDQPVLLQPGEKFAVVVKLTNPAGSALIYRESSQPLAMTDGSAATWTAQAYMTSQAGQSFTSLNGTSWSDVGADNQGNLAIKALSADAITIDVTVTGMAKVGQTITAQVTSQPAASYTYQWLRNGEPVPGQTRAAYTITDADQNTNLSVRVTATAPGYGSTTVTTTPILLWDLTALLAPLMDMLKKWLAQMLLILGR